MQGAKITRISCSEDTFTIETSNGIFFLPNAPNTAKLVAIALDLQAQVNDLLSAIEVASEIADASV